VDISFYRQQDARLASEPTVLKANRSENYHRLEQHNTLAQVYTQHVTSAECLEINSVFDFKPDTAGYHRHVGVIRFCSGCGSVLFVFRFS